MFALAWRSRLRCFVWLGTLVLACGSDWVHRLDHGSVLGFPSYDEANDLLESWLREHPALLSKRSIGKSYEGRPINVYVLSGSAADVERPQVLLTSLTHAREPAGLTVLLYFLGRLLELYANRDPEALYLVHSRRIFLVPFVNPDGYIANAALEDKIVRKNRRPTCSDATKSGIDLNRNFGLHWKSEFDGCNEEFAGKEAFSEPEVRALRALVESEAGKIKAAMNFHTYGGMLTHPFNYSPHPMLPDADQKIYRELGEVFNWNKFGPAIATVGYTTSGEMDDWMYGRQGIISMSPEVGPEAGGFWPPSYTILGICRRNFQRILSVAHKAGSELYAAPALMPSVVKDVAAAAPPLEFSIANRGLSRTESGCGVAMMTSGEVDVSDLSARCVGGLQQTPCLLRLLPGTRKSIVSFALPPLADRSEQSFQLVSSSGLRTARGRPVRVRSWCILEATQAAYLSEHQLCQCFEQKGRNSSWIRADPGARGLPALCAAAARATAGLAPPAAPAVLGESDAAVDVRLGAGRDDGAPVQVLSVLIPLVLGAMLGATAVLLIKAPRPRRFFVPTDCSEEALRRSWRPMRVAVEDEDDDDDDV